MAWELAFSSALAVPSPCAPPSEPVDMVCNSLNVGLICNCSDPPLDCYIPLPGAPSTVTTLPLGSPALSSQGNLRSFAMVSDIGDDWDLKTIQ